MQVEVACLTAEERDRDREERLARLLRMVAPGTPLREGLEYILRARTGALIVVSDSPQVLALVDGGFRVDAEYTPARVYELAKMDGAIVLSADGRRILYANTQLTPDANIPAHETGMRHRAAERTARQTGELAIAISQRRNVISLYRGTLRYVLRDPALLLAKASQALQALERHRAVLDQTLINLNALELEDLVTVTDVAVVIQRTEMVMRIMREIERQVLELGTEGRLVEMQMQELVSHVLEEGRLVIRDYLQPSDDRGTVPAEEMLAGADILDLASIARLLGLGMPAGTLESPASPRGYRLLRRIPRLPTVVIENIITRFGQLPAILRATFEELDEVEGIGEARARAIREGLHRLKEQAMLERTI